MERKFWFKIAMTPHSNEFPININWTISEFITNMKPILMEYFSNELPNGTQDIDILDNISNNEPENLRQPILPDDTITINQKYTSNQMKFNNLAFYIRPILPNYTFK